jgi:hypothetical protein
MRSEPFATIHIDIQGGKFDHASRLFLSVADAWRLGRKHRNTYRELIPEFYCTWDFLRNENGFDLGSTAAGPVGDVGLPPWADSPASFVYRMRQALESPAVSAQLHLWIDLVWGFKQRGPDAAKSHNLYPPMLYETVWTKRLLADDAQRAVVEASLCHIGQVPAQLFRTRHPPRRAVRGPPFVRTHAVVPLPAATACVRIAGGKIELAVADGPRLLAFRLSAPEGALRLRLRAETRAMERIVRVIDSGAALLETGHILGGPGALAGAVSAVALSGKFWAAVGADSALRLIGPTVNATVQFYGDVIRCCAVSRTFKMAVCGTVARHIVIVSLFAGEKVCVAEIGLTILEIVITEAWGFIVVNALADDGRTVFVVLDVNGREIRRVVMPALVTAWSSWTSRSGFDFVLVAVKTGDVFNLEAFFCEVGEPICHVAPPIVALAYHEEGQVVVVLSETKVTCVPCQLPR